MVGGIFSGRRVTSTGIDLNGISDFGKPVYSPSRVVWFSHRYNTGEKWLGKWLNKNWNSGWGNCVVIEQSSRF